MFLLVTNYYQLCPLLPPTHNIRTYIQQTSKCLLPPFSPIRKYHQLPLLTRDHIHLLSHMRILHSRKPICADGSEITVGTPAVTLQHKGDSKDTGANQNSTEGFHLVCERWILDGAREEKHLSCMYSCVGLWKLCNLQIYIYIYMYISCKFWGTMFIQIAMFIFTLNAKRSNWCEALKRENVRSKYKFSIYVRNWN